MMFINIFIHKRRAAKPSCNIIIYVKNFFSQQIRYFGVARFDSRIFRQQPQILSLVFLVPIIFRGIFSPCLLEDCYSQLYIIVRWVSVTPPVLTDSSDLNSLLFTSFHLGLQPLYFFYPLLLLARSLRLDRYLPPINWSVRVLCLQSIGGSYRLVASQKFR